MTAISSTTIPVSNNNTIRAIDRESVHRICSGQVVLDMATAVKELLENSLDAGATSIVIKFKQSGLEHISVTDNGSGITDVNLETLALKHYTSKLRSFNDLAMVRSFGFRGEALSSLCALANLTVATSTGNSPMGVLAEFTSNGTIQSKTPTPMTKGTVVKICNLFEGMPVRRSEFVKNIKREYAKCIGLIQAYALIVTNVRISCVSQVDKKPPTTQIATNGNASIRQNIINVFGPKAMMDVVDFELLLVEGGSGSDEGSGKDSGADDGDIDEDGEQDQKGDIILKGCISSPAFGKGRSSTDRQYVFINGRPCMLPKIARVINEVYHSFNTNQSPFLVANLILPTSYYDVNVSPDKRTIFLHNERQIVEELRNKLTELFQPSRSTFAVSQASQLIKKPDLATRIGTAPIGIHSLTSGDVDVQDEGNDNGGDNEALRDRLKENRVEPVSLSSLSLLRSTATRLEQTTLADRMRPVARVEGLKRKASDDASSDLDDAQAEELIRDQLENKESDASLVSPNNTVAYPNSMLEVLEGYDPLDDRSRDDQSSASDSDNEQEQNLGRQGRSSTLLRVVVLDSEVLHDGDREWVEVEFDMKEQRRRRAIRMNITQETRRLEQEKRVLRKMLRQKELLNREQSATVMSSKPVEENDDPESADSDQASAASYHKKRRLRTQKLSDASFANIDDAKAQKSLSRIISKTDFSRMKILGQFNKAFIVARLDNYAVDEDDNDQQHQQHNGNKHGQRRLSRGTLVSSDIFVIDQHASDEKYNFETLQAKTVFSTQRLFQPKKLYLTAQEEITVVDHMKMLNKNGFYLEHDPEAPVSHRLKLVTLPVSEKVVFDLQDFEELVFMLSQQTTLPDASVDASSSDQEGRNDHQGDQHPHHDHVHCTDGNNNSSKSQKSNGGGAEKMVRCSKVRALFASRACRRSVMIGHVLNHSQMKTIVRHMGEIDQPWNCPHGRPTMRHLLDLTELEQQERQARLGGDAGAASSREGKRYGNEVENDDEETDETLLKLESKLLNMDRTSAFDPIALKRPTRHQGSLFRQFMAIPEPRICVS
ncbi:Mismatch repair endonuclease pms2 [Dissophora globulifera]|nr:Mismatch repair endonuclease pms2 [Dissophora globulifera]